MNNSNKQSRLRKEGKDNNIFYRHNLSYGRVLNCNSDEKFNEYQRKMLTIHTENKKCM